MKISVFGLALMLPCVGVGSDVHAAVNLLSFDGNDRVIIDDTPALNPTTITVEARVNFGRLAVGSGFDGDDWQFLISKGGDRTYGTYRLIQGAEPDLIGFGVGPYFDGATVYKHVPSLETNHWYHLAGTYDGTSLKLIIDGVLVSSLNVGIPAIAIGNTSPLYLSYNDVKTSSKEFPYYFTGLMDEVRIWNYARSAAEIRTTMDTSLTGSEPGLVGYWTFDEDSTSQVVNDATINGSDGQLGSTLGVDDDDPTRVVPEPGSVAVWSFLIMVGVGYQRWRKRSR